MSKKTKIVLVNAPFVLHGDSGLFLGLDNFIAYDELKGRMRRLHPPFVIQSMFPLNTGVRYGVRAGSRWPFTCDSATYGYIPFPFIMAYTSSYLAANGMETAVVDCVARHVFDYQAFLAEVRGLEPDIVIVESSTTSIAIDVWVAEKISEFAETALAGPHITDVTAEDLRARHPGIRYFLKGEYIKSALEMARTRRAGIYEPDVVTDLDAIPFPDRSFSGAQAASDAWIPGLEGPQLQMWGSKGCPFRCKYCLWPQTMYQRKVALRKPEHIAREIVTDVARYGYKHVFFDDDTFNMGNERIAELCDRMKEIGLPWGVMARLDTSPLELFEKMIASGCKGFKFGVESFDETVLQRIGKGLEKKDFTSTLVRLVTKYPHIKFHLTMMRDLPGQTDAIHDKDMEILDSLGFMAGNPLRTYQLSSCVPFPGTELYAELTANGCAEKLAGFKGFDGTRRTVMRELR